MNKGSCVVAALLLMGVCPGASVASPRDLAGHWACPGELRLAAAGQTELTLELSTRTHLRSGGRYESVGEAVLRLGRWPLKLAANSHGQWQRNAEQVALTVENLELTPGSSTGIEFQQTVIQQLHSMLPEFPHAQSARIASESDTQVVLEDESGQRHTCSRI
jgi:hypothetical protein